MPVKKYRPVHHNNIDFERISRGVTKYAYGVGFCEYLINTHLPVLDEFETINQRAMASASEEERGRLRVNDNRLRTQISLLRGTLKGCLARTDFLSKRAQSQVQNVDISPQKGCLLIADSKMNRYIASLRSMMPP